MAQIGPLTRADTLEMGKRMLQVMQPSMLLLGIDVHVSPSIGIAFYPGDGATVDTCWGTQGGHRDGPASHRCRGIICRPAAIV